jgi:hypothetical protein
MKILSFTFTGRGPLLKKLILGTIFLSSLVPFAHAANAYFDQNNATPGSGITAGGTYSWEGNVWTSDGTGSSSTFAWVDGDFPRFSAGTDATGSYTVTVGSDHTIAGMFEQTGTANTITINSTGGKLNIASGIQGFFVRGGCNMVLNVNLAGPGGVQNSTSGGTGSGSYFLYGTNTYSGGTVFNTAGGLNIKNSQSLGTGPVTWGVAQQVLADPDATTPLALANAMVTRGASQLIVVTPTAAPITFSGPWTNAAGISRLTMNNAATKMTIAGPIYGSGATLLKDGVGLLVINGTNADDTATTTVTNGTLEVGGTLKGTVNVQRTAGILQLDTATALASTATLRLSNSLAAGSVKLNFTGSNQVAAIYIDSVLQASGSWGALGSGANNENALFTGTGFLYVPAAPVIVQQPASQSAYPQTPTRTFSISVSGDQPSMTYHWKLNNVNLVDGANVSGSQTATLTLSPPYSAGTYTVAMTNSAGFATSQPVTLTLLATNDYVNSVLASSPVAYWRLDETNATANGVAAHDWVGFHHGVYSNVTLNLPGFSSVSGSDPAMWAPRTALSGNANKGIMIISNAAPDFSFGGFPFTLEAWGMSTNFGAGVKQRLVSTLSTTGTGGYGFGFPNSTTLEFTSGGVQNGDYDVTLGTPLAQGVWYHFVAAYDGNNMNFYVNGASVGSIPIPVNIPAPANQLTLGNNPLLYPTEQLQGAIDEVAVYNSALDSGTIANHYQARYSDLSAPTVTTPVATPATNYVSLTTSLFESAGGAGLAYQWYKGSGTGSPVPGGTSATLTLSNLQLSDAGTYHCMVTDAGSHTADSPLVTVTVLPIPTSASQLNLTNKLVLHLPFESDYKDISGRQNNGAPAGAPTLAGSGVVGTNALHFGTTNGLGTNFVTLGVRPDLQFSSNIDFSVSYWVRGNNTTLPFFCDSTNSLTGIYGLGGGFYFGPSTNGNGSWSVGLGGTIHEAVASGGSFINDGNWHHLVHVSKRVGSQTTYLDGVSVDTHAISFITESVDSGNSANIGQDGLGTVVLADAEGDIDDLAVWTRTLTDLEVSGMYLAGATNHVSFAPAVSNPSPAVTIQVQQVGNQYQLVWTGGGTLQASPIVNGTYTNVTAASSPYTLPVSSGPQLFYRVQF